MGGRSLVIDRATRAVYNRAGLGHAVRRGNRPAVLVVDFTYGFTDPTYDTGADMAEQVTATGDLLAIARAKTVPVVFTTIAFDAGEVTTLPWLDKAPGLVALRPGSRLVEVDGRLLPRVDETVLVKTGASAFFGTPLPTILAARRVDTLIVAGATTSGCVRASVVDAVQFGYPVLVARQCVADRAQGPHEASLFDMNEKYADVVDLAEVIAYLRSLPER
jgi:nicotinamidase-related amidase